MLSKWWSLMNRAISNIPNFLWNSLTVFWCITLFFPAKLLKWITLLVKYIHLNWHRFYSNTAIYINDSLQPAVPPVHIAIGILQICTNPLVYSRLYDDKTIRLLLNKTHLMASNISFNMSWSKSLPPFTALRFFLNSWNTGQNIHHYFNKCGGNLS